MSKTAELQRVRFREVMARAGLDEEGRRLPGADRRNLFADEQARPLQAYGQSAPVESQPMTGPRGNLSGKERQKAEEGLKTLRGMLNDPETKSDEGTQRALLKGIQNLKRKLE